MKLTGPKGRADRWCARWIRSHKHAYSASTAGMAGFQAGYEACLRDVGRNSQRSAAIQGPGTLGELRAELIRYKKRLFELTGSARL